MPLTVAPPPRTGDAAQGPLFTDSSRSVVPDHTTPEPAEPATEPAHPKPAATARTVAAGVLFAALGAVAGRDGRARDHGRPAARLRRRAARLRRAAGGPAGRRVRGEATSPRSLLLTREWAPPRAVTAALAFVVGDGLAAVGHPAPGRAAGDRRHRARARPRSARRRRTPRHRAWPARRPRRGRRRARDRRRRARRDAPRRSRPRPPRRANDRRRRRGAGGAATDDASGEADDRRGREREHAAKRRPNGARAAATKRRPAKRPPAGHAPRRGRATRSRRPPARRPATPASRPGRGAAESAADGRDRRSDRRGRAEPGGHERRRRRRGPERLTPTRRREAPAAAERAERGVRERAARGGPRVGAARRRPRASSARTTARSTRALRRRLDVALARACRTRFGGFARLEGRLRARRSTASRATSPSRPPASGVTVKHLLIARDTNCAGERRFSVTWTLRRVSEQWSVTGLTAAAVGANTRKMSMTSTSNASMPSACVLRGPGHAGPSLDGVPPSAVRGHARRTVGARTRINAQGTGILTVGGRTAFWTLAS